MTELGRQRKIGATSPHRRSAREKYRLVIRSANLSDAMDDMLSGMDVFGGPTENPCHTRLTARP